MVSKFDIHFVSVCSSAKSMENMKRLLLLMLGCSVQVTQVHVAVWACTHTHSHNKVYHNLSRAQGHVLIYLDTSLKDGWMVLINSCTDASCLVPLCLWFSIEIIFISLFFSPSLTVLTLLVQGQGKGVKRSYCEKIRGKTARLTSHENDDAKQLPHSRHN